MYWKGVNLYSSGETSATGGDFGSAFIWQSGLEFFPVETGIVIDDSEVSRGRERPAMPK